MKETTKMSRAVGQLEKIYNALNADLFNGTLPVPIITVQSKPGTYGHCTTSKVKLTEYALKKGWSEIRICRGGMPRLHITAGGTQSSNPAEQTEGGKRPSSTRKYICPCCKNSVRATKAVNIICGDCMEKMEVAK